MVSIRSFSIQTLTFLTMLITFSIFCSSNSFVLHRQANEILTRNKDSQLQMNFFDHQSTLLDLASPILSTSLSPVKLPDDAGSEILGETSHITDFLTAVGSQMSPLSISILSICSRICSIGSDFLPGHNVPPSELAYQTIMLTIASVGVFKTLKAVSNNQSCTMRHKRCYVSLFRPGGLSWIQFKQISESGALEWMEFCPGSTITYAKKDDETQERLYWLQTGDLEFQHSGNTVQLVNTESQSRLFGSLRFPASFTQGPHVHMAIKAGPGGAKVLRIDTIKLKKVMHQDRSLIEPIQRMQLQGMRANMASLIFLQQNL